MRERDRLPISFYKWINGKPLFVIEAKLPGAKDERLPYPIGNDSISKADSATEEQKSEPSEVIAVSYDKQGLAVDPFVEELEVPRCV